MQKTLYAGIIGDCRAGVHRLDYLEAGSFSELTALIGGFQAGRLLHFIGMTAIVLFLVVHVALALLVPKTIGAMVTGGPDVPDAERPPPLSRRIMD